MKPPAFVINNLGFFEIEPAEGKATLELLSHTCGLHKIPPSTWEKDLSPLPTQIKSPYCSAVFVSCNALTGVTTLDIIRKEKNRRQAEPPYNCTCHYIIKNSDGALYISEQFNPAHHWAVCEVRKKIYGDDCLD
jgi:hypothetical protein